MANASNGASGTHNDEIRNLAVVGHGHAGKTTLVDAIAHHLKLTTRLGSTADGTSISDTEPEEKERHQTLASHVFHIPAGPVQLNVFDTPGHPDFLAEAIAAIDVVETAVLVVNATNPLTFHARQLWDAAGRAGIGRAIVVTHLDQDNTNFDQVAAELREAFGHAAVPVTYPNATGGGFDAVHDVTHDEGPDAPKYHEMIEEDEAEVDDTLMEHYLEEGHLSQDEFEQNLRRAIARGKLAPIFAVCPNRGLGMAQLVEFLQKHFPSPLCYGARGAAKPGTDVYGQLVEPDEGPFAAKVWKVVSDPYVGRLDVPACLPRRAQEGRDRRRHPHRQEPQGRASAQRERHRDQGGRRDLGRRSVCDLQDRGLRPGRHSHRRRRAARVSAAVVSRADLLSAHLAEVARRRAEDRRSAREARRRGRDAQVPPRPGNRRAAGHRHEPDAPGDHVPAPAPPPRRRHRAGAADDSVPRDDHVACRGAPPPQEAVRRSRPVRRGLPAHRAAGARCRLRVRRLGRRRFDPAAVHRGGREGQPQVPRQGCRSPASRSSTCRSKCTTASSTTSTATR